MSTNSNSYATAKSNYSNPYEPKTERDFPTAEKLRNKNIELMRKLKGRHSMVDIAYHAQEIGATDVLAQRCEALESSLADYACEDEIFWNDGSIAADHAWEDILEVAMINNFNAGTSLWKAFMEAVCRQENVIALDCFLCYLKNKCGTFADVYNTIYDELRRLNYEAEAEHYRRAILTGEEVD